MSETGLLGLPIVTPPGETRALKQVLINEYGHFSDKRIKNIDRGSVFIVDGRGSGDCGADRQIFLWFCTIYAEVVDSKTVKITLGGGIPRGQSVEKWIHDHGIENSERLIFDVTPSDVVKLTELATAFRAIVRPGIQYPVKANKYVCPRTAGALDRLHAVLADHWKNIE